MAAVDTERGLLRRASDGIWWLDGWDAGRARAGVADGRATRDTVRSQLPRQTSLIEAEQVHGSSTALVEYSRSLPTPIAGCDALITRLNTVALAIRTADCLPLFVSDPVRGAVGLAHVGWRGLAAQLPARVVAAFRHAVHSRPEDLRVAIGPAIRACCYEVSEDFGGWAHAFLQRRDGRLTFDLIGLARRQLAASGIRPERIADSDMCTACHDARWPSIRRERRGAGSILSFIVLQ